MMDYIFSEKEKNIRKLWLLLNLLRVTFDLSLLASFCNLSLPMPVEQLAVLLSACLLLEGVIFLVYYFTFYVKKWGFFAGLFMTFNVKVALLFAFCTLGSPFRILSALGFCVSAALLYYSIKLSGLNRRVKKVRAVT